LMLFNDAVQKRGALLLREADAERAAAKTNELYSKAVMLNELTKVHQHMVNAVKIGAPAPLSLIEVATLDADPLIVAPLIVASEGPPANLQAKAWGSADMARATYLHVVDVGSIFNIVPLWTIGVCVCIAGTLFTSLGLVVQKYSHSKNAKLGAAVVYYDQPWWVFGFSVFFAGQIIGVVAMPMAPQAMLSCLGALSLIFNAVFAWAMLGEQLHRLELAGMMGIIIGAVVVIHTTPAERGLDIDTAGLSEIVGPLFGSGFLCLGARIAAILCVFGAFAYSRGPHLISIFWAMTSGVCSGYTVTCFKCISYLAVSYERTQPMLHCRCYMVLMVAIFLCFGQLHTVNTALHSGRAMSVVPTIFAFNLLAQIGIGEAAYMEMEGMRTAQAVGFGCGIVLILVCVVAIVRMSGMKTALQTEGVAFEAKLEESFESKVADETGTPFYGRSTSLPARKFSLESFEDLGHLFQRTHSETWLDHDDFSESFNGRSRAYTVSLTGPMGLA